MKTRLQTIFLLFLVVSPSVHAFCVSSLAAKASLLFEEFWLGVDLFSTGSLYTPKLIELGYKPVLVITSPRKNPLYWGFDEKLYEGRIFKLWEYESVEALANVLRARFRFAGSTLGTDRGVEVYDLLNRLLKLPGNDPDTSNLRSDKEDMGRAVSDVEEFASGSLDAIKAWVRKREARMRAEGEDPWPLAVKVPKAVGGFGFHVVSNEEELEIAFNDLINKPDSMGNIVRKVLVQEYLDGPVMAFNVVANEDGYYITDVMEYKTEVVTLANRRKAVICLDTVVIPPWDPRIDELDAFFGKHVLAATGMLIGISHNEGVYLKKPRKDGKRVKFLEVNPRAIGAQLTSLVEAATGENPLDIDLESRTNRAAFARRVGKRYTNWRPNRAVDVVTKRAGKVVAIPGIPIIEALDGFVLHRGLVLNKILEESRDLASLSGMVFFADYDQTKVDESAARVNELNDAGELFQIEPVTESRP